MVQDKADPSLINDYHVHIRPGLCNCMQRRLPRWSSSYCCRPIWYFIFIPVLTQRERLLGIIHSKAYGLRSPKDANSPLREDDILFTASCTKLLTSIAAMQCVERGLIRLEDDVTTLLPELGKLPVLTGFDDEGKPILTKRTNPITLRFAIFCLRIVVRRTHSQELIHAYLWTRLQLCPPRSNTLPFFRLHRRNRRNNGHFQILLPAPLPTRHKLVLRSRFRLVR